MDSRTRLTRRAAALGVLGLYLSGCGGAGPAISPEQQGLAEFAAAYRHFVLKHNRGPLRVEDLRAAGQSYPNAIQMVRSGELVVVWGAPLSPSGETADAVLAYVRSAPALGGGVIMQDGRTVRSMSAEEFQAAPKAAASAPPARTSKGRKRA
jgi:hypothetical protein